MEQVRWTALAGVFLASCAAPQAGAPVPPNDQPEAAQSPDAVPAPQPDAGPVPSPYALRNAPLVVVAEPLPEVRYTQKSLTILPPKNLLDVARQATVRIGNADVSDGDAPIRRIAPPRFDIASAIEPLMLRQLVETFDLPGRATRVEDRVRAFDLTADGSAGLASAIGGAGLKGYALDVRVDELEISTTGRTLTETSETFSLIAKVGARLIDLDAGTVVREAVCNAEEELGTYRPVTETAEAAATPDAPETAEAPVDDAAPSAGGAAAETPTGTSTGVPPATAALERGDTAEGQNAAAVEPRAATSPAGAGVVGASATAVAAAPADAPRVAAAPATAPAQTQAPVIPATGALAVPRGASPDAGTVSAPAQVSQPLGASGGLFTPAQSTPDTADTTPVAAPDTAPVTARNAADAPAAPGNPAASAQVPGTGTQPPLKRVGSYANIVNEATGGGSGSAAAPPAAPPAVATPAPPSTPAEPGVSAGASAGVNGKAVKPGAIAASQSGQLGIADLAAQKIAQTCANSLWQAFRPD